jgi:hypothetical protein
VDIVWSQSETQYAVWLDVTGEDVPAHEGRSGEFYPTSVVLRYTDYHNGEAPDVQVSLHGVAVVKGGARGKAERSDQYVRDACRPEWVQKAIIDHAPAWWTTAR